jgi:hypothetical protein
MTFKRSGRKTKKSLCSCKKCHCLRAHCQETGSAVKNRVYWSKNALWASNNLENWPQGQASQSDLHFYNSLTLFKHYAHLCYPENHVISEKVHQIVFQAFHLHFWPFQGRKNNFFIRQVWCKIFRSFEIRSQK